MKNEGMIRAFTEKDYRAVVEIHNAVFPERPESVEVLRSADRERDPRSRCGRWVYEDDSRITAMAAYRQEMSSENGLNFYLQLEVHPTRCGRGIGSELYAWLEKALALYEPRSLFVEVATASGLNFVKARGFRELGQDFPEINSFGDLHHEGDSAGTVLEKIIGRSFAIAGREEKIWST